MAGGSMALMSSPKPVRLYDPSLAEIDDGWVLPDEVVLATQPTAVTAAPSKAQPARTTLAADGWGLAPEDPAPEEFAPEPPATPGKVDLNTATFEDLRGIPGIGPLRARRILSWRAQNGRFEAVGDLEFVRGIGAKTVVQLSDHLLVD